MMENTVKVLPSPTWRWLKVNEVSIPEIETLGSLNAISIKAGEDKVYELPMNHTASARECIDLVAEKDSKGLVIIDHTSEGKGIDSALTLNYELNDSAEVTVVELFRLDNKDSIISGISGSCKENARINIYQVFLGGKDIYVNIINDLVGDKSYFGLKSAYKLYEGNNLDINYVVNHIGKKTECELDSKGVLYKGANKTYRGTIDFKQGAKGAVGNEIEDVLLMDEDVVNKTVPVILCAEEDVEGNHGATIGRIGEDLMFYLRSRGIPEDEIYVMMADARIESVVRDIPHEGTRNMLYGLLGKEDQGE